MAIVFAELNPAGDRAEVHFRYDPEVVKAVKDVIGAKFVPKDKGGPFWTIPLTLEHVRRLKSGVERRNHELTYGRALKAWGREASRRETQMHTLAASDDVPIKELEISKTLPKLAAWFRPYQRADVKFLGATSALNLNQPGLGKTTETIAAVFEAGIENGAHLVVAPKTSLETVWRWEIERWTDELEKPHEVITYHGDLSTKEREEAIDAFWECIDDDWPVWFVTTPDAIRRGNEPALEEWNTFIIDEFHRHGLTNVSGAKDKGTMFGRAVREIKAKRRYALSGTPMGGKPIKLWGALHFLYPEQFTSKWAWAGLWLNINNNGFGKEIGGLLPGKEDAFYKSLAPYAVRRLKSEVLPQLPAKQYVDVWCDMTTKQAKQYREMKDRAEAMIDEQAMGAPGVLAQYTRLKVFADAYCDDVKQWDDPCNKCDGTGVNPDTYTPEPEPVDDNAAYHGYEDDPTSPEHMCPKCMGTGKLRKWKAIPSSESGKIPALMDRLAEIGIEPGDMEGEAQAVVATQFKEVADMVHRYLNEKKIPCEKITGDTKNDDRARIQKAFQSGGANAPRVVVMTTTAGGVAITLDMADTIHILDETWVPDDQEQLEDRVHRASRMHQVTCYYYRSKGTIEEDIFTANVDKASINKEILDIRRNIFRKGVQERVTSGE